MSWPTILCSSVAAACLTLAGVHFIVWWKNRDVPANLWFSVLAVGVALFSWGSLLMNRAQTTEAFAWALWWTQFTILVMVAGVVGFVMFHFRTARRWLGHGAWVLRLITLVAHVVRRPNSDFDQISALHFVSFLGEPVSVAQGSTSIWFWANQASLVMLFLFVVDACYALWRVGDAREKRRALVIGVPTACFVLLGGISATLIFSGAVVWPHLEFVPFLGMLLAMAYELSSDVLRAAQLSRELQVSEAALRDSDHRMTMAADAARLGMWIRDLGCREVWLSTKCREILAFPADEAVTYEAFVSRLHPDDRSRIEAEFQRLLEAEDVHRTDYRLALPDRSIRWIAAQVRIDRDESSKAVRMLGICIDVTEQRNAEIAARELSGRLISAQEDERRRIARDLHDDLSQRLSILSVDLELFARTQAERRGVVQLASQVQELSSEVHKVAYQLHPAKLDQLGLEIAVRSWCRDVTHQSGVRVEFVAAAVPRDVPADIALCVYRIVQEALRNVVRHSQATDARVELMSAGGELHLLVADSGRGFNVEAAIETGGLGLVGMRERALILGGKLSVRSVPGEGTRVTVSIPVPPAHAVDPAVGSSGVSV